MMCRTSTIALLGFLSLPAFAFAQEAVPKPETTQHPVDEAAEATGDAWITAKVKADLLVTENVAGTDINVDTKDGVVTLSGAVSTQAEADKAKEVAGKIKGVTSVNSELTVAP
jgi:hyperosmotically inducible protein